MVKFDTCEQYRDVMSLGPKGLLEPRTCLYVGAWRDGTAFLQDLFEPGGYKVDLLEIWKPSCDLFRGEIKTHGGRVIQADVRTWKPDRQYDLVMWWHGPEHVSAGDAELALAKLDKVRTHALITAVPNGHYEQGPVDGNAAQRHISEYTPDWFQTRGFCVANTARQIIAWRVA